MLRNDVVRISVQSTLKYIASACLVVLAGCSVQPNGMGGYVVSSPTLGQVFSGATSGASASANISAPTAATKYVGPIDGGTATLTVTPVGNSQYQIDLGANAAGGATGGGGVSGTIEPDGKSDGGYILTQISDGGVRPLPCALDVKFAANTAQISEDFKRDKEGCIGYHGAALSFDGVLTQQN